MALNGILNFGAHTALIKLQNSHADVFQSLAKLAAGRRVQAARDGAAALAIGSRLATEIGALLQARFNAGQGLSMLRIADGGMAQINDALARMKALAVQAGSDSLSASERSALNVEFQALATEIDRIAADTEFSGTKLLDGSTGFVNFKVGTRTDPFVDELNVVLTDTRTAALSLGSTDLLTKENANAAIGALNDAIDTIQVVRTQVGAGQSRLEFASANISTAIENMEAVRSGLVDLGIILGAIDVANTSISYEAGLFSLNSAAQQSKHLLRLLV